MQSRLNPYLAFKGDARAALEFYRTVFGGTIEMKTYKEFNVSQDPSEDNKLMHGMLEGESGIIFMAADTPNAMGPQSDASISMALSGDNHAELSGYFAKLSAGGTIREPLVQAPWGDTFGMCTDKFGIEWMVNIAGKPA